MGTEELKACPFCGGTARAIEYHAGYGSVWCDNCRIEIPNHEWEELPIKDAIKKWNTRAENV